MLLPLSSGPKPPARFPAPRCVEKTPFRNGTSKRRPFAIAHRTDFLSHRRIEKTPFRNGQVGPGRATTDYKSVRFYECMIRIRAGPRRARNAALGPPAGDCAITTAAPSVNVQSILYNDTVRPPPPARDRAITVVA